jgi:hypothetical protein
VAVLDRFDMVSEYRDSASYAAFLKEMVQEEAELIRRLNLTAD